MSLSEYNDLDGILVIDKPAGITSHDVVARVRRLLGVKRVGHGGTLDPFATGVLPIAVGRATRVLQYVQNADKGYRVTLELGAETDTGDTEGAVIERRSADAANWPTRADIDATLRKFVGDLEQIPPAHSAIKVDGQPLYRRARAGETVNVPPRQVRVELIDVLRYEPPLLELEIACGKGTYIRALARDIGRALGTFAFCRELRRTRTGPFTLDEARTLEQLGALDPRANWRAVALGADAALPDFMALTLDRASTNAWFHGRPVALRDEQPASPGTLVRIYSVLGHFAGIGAVGADRRATPEFVIVPTRIEREP